MCLLLTIIPVESSSVGACSVEAKLAAECMNTGRKGLCAACAVQGTGRMQCRAQITLRLAYNEPRIAVRAFHAILEANASAPRMLSFHGMQDALLFHRF